MAVSKKSSVAKIRWLGIGMINISKDDNSSFAGMLNPLTTSKPNSSNVNPNLAAEYHSGSLSAELDDAIASALSSESVNWSVNTSPNQTE